MEVDSAESPTPPGALPLTADAYEDEHVAVVDKPAGLSLCTGAGHATGACPDPGPPAEIPSAKDRPPLDRDTSGLMVVSKSEEAYEGLRAARTARSESRVPRARPRPPGAARSGQIERQSAATGVTHRCSLAPTSPKDAAAPRWSSPCRPRVPARAAGDGRRTQIACTRRRSAAGGRRPGVRNGARLVPRSCTPPGSRSTTPSRGPDRRRIAASTRSPGHILT